MGLLGLQGGGRRQDLSIGSQTVAIDEFEIEGRACPPIPTLRRCGSNISPWSLSRSRKRMPDCATSPRSRSLGRSSCPPHLAAFRPSSFAILTGTLSNCCSFRKTIRRRHGRIEFLAPGQISLGVDHSAISVHDADTSVAFYGGLALKRGKSTFNAGPAQQRLDDLHKCRGFGRAYDPGYGRAASRTPRLPCASAAQDSSVEGERRGGHAHPLARRQGRSVARPRRPPPTNRAVIS